jgi:hypothetical protein
MGVSLTLYNTFKISYEITILNERGGEYNFLLSCECCHTFFIGHLK